MRKERNQKLTEPNEYRTKLIQRISEESIAETINNLPSFDDYLWAASSISSPDPFAEYATFRVLIPRLCRLRRILQECPSEGAARTDILRHVKDKLLLSITKIADATKERDASDPKSKYAPTDYQRYSVYGAACVYLLSELKDYSAIPLLHRTLIRSDVPVSRVFLFCALHSLISDYPVDQLSPERKTYHRDYLIASSELPRFRRLKVPTWNAKFEEWDFRIEILNKDIGIDKEKHITVTLYPVEFHRYDAPNREVTKDGKALFQKLEAALEKFVSAAFP